MRRSNAAIPVSPPPGKPISWSPFSRLLAERISIERFDAS